MRTATSTLLLLLAFVVHCNALYYVVEENKKVYDYLFGSEDKLRSLSTFPLCYEDGKNTTGESKLSNMTFREFRRLTKMANNSYMEVHFFMKIFQITEVSERDQSVRLIMGIDLEWHDCRLTWADHESTARYIDLPPQRFRELGIYMPSVLFLESTEPTAGKDSEIKTSIGRAGYVRVSSEFAAAISCNIDVKLYPFDTQECNMTFESPLNSEQIRLYDGLEKDTMQVQSAFLLGKGRFIPSDTWDVIILPPTYRRRLTCVKDDSRVNSTACYTDSLQYRLLLQRHPTYQLVNLMVPAFLVIIISSCVFILPPGSGDKMGLSVTILLSMFVFTQLMYDKMPETGSSLPLLSEFFMVCVALVSASCLYSAISAVLANATTPVPQNLQRFVKALGPRLLADMMRPPHDDDASENDPHENGGETKAQRAENGEENQNETSVGMHIDAAHEINWNAAAALIDRCFFIFHMLLSIAVLLGFTIWGYSCWMGDYKNRLTEKELEYVSYQNEMQETVQD